MSKIKNEIDVFLPTIADRYSRETNAGIDLAKAVHNYEMCGSSRPSKYFDNWSFFEYFPFGGSDSRLYELCEMLGDSYWGVNRVGEDYLRTVPFPVLLSFAYRLSDLRFRQAGNQLYGDPAQREEGINSGMVREAGKIKIWFVKFGVGRFALDLADISDATARDVGLLGGNFHYLPDEEFKVCKELDIYPMVDIALNRYKHYWVCDNQEREGVMDELRAQWKTNDASVLPKKQIKVNLIEVPADSAYSAPYTTSMSMHVGHEMANQIEFSG